MAQAGRPFILVLAGVNGAGKSSVGGALLQAQGLPWFNPDSYARELVRQLGLGITEANARAWEYGRAALAEALAQGWNYALETTLGGNTLPRMLAEASQTHDVTMIFCGLATAELHLERVRARVAVGGHDIPAQKIRERWVQSRANLVALLPALAHLQVFDNSVQALPGDDIPDPVLLLEMAGGKVLFPKPKDAEALRATPDWAKPVVQAAIESAGSARLSPSGRSSPGRSPSS